MDGFCEEDERIVLFRVSGQGSDEDQTPRRRSVTASSAGEMIPDHESFLAYRFNSTLSVNGNGTRCGSSVALSLTCAFPFQHEATSGKWRPDRNCWLGSPPISDRQRTKERVNGRSPMHQNTSDLTRRTTMSQVALGREIYGGEHGPLRSDDISNEPKSTLTRVAAWITSS
jgi:hypothetical protein